MNYRNLDDMTRTIRANLHRIPKVDVVAGIPRSGMIPASIIATLTNQPLANVNELLTGVWRGLKHGGRWNGFDKPVNILLVDDTISGGQTFTRVCRDLHDTWRNEIELQITKLAVYRKPSSPALAINVYFETVPGPRVFEWNFYKHPNHTPTAVFDIDGVICAEAPNGLDEEQFTQDRKNGKLLRRPEFAPRAYATGRKERYRELTEQWMHLNGIPPAPLYMTEPGSNARKTKLRAIQETGAKWMVESNENQAEWLNRGTGIPVLCTDTNVLFPALQD